MKNIILILALFSFFYGNAQNSEYTVRRFEGEIGTGLVWGTGKLGCDEIDLGATIYAEARYNLRRLPLDVGLQVASSIFHRDAYNVGREPFKSGTIMAVADYNFRRMSNASFFAGVGVGYAAQLSTAPFVFDDSLPNNWSGFSTGDARGSFCVMPRVGVELWRHLRITAAYKVAEKANCHFDLTIGVVFGGGKREPK